MDRNVPLEDQCIPENNWEVGAKGEITQVHHFHCLSPTPGPGQLPEVEWGKGG